MRNQQSGWAANPTTRPARAPYLGRESGVLTISLQETAPASVADPAANATISRSMPNASDRLVPGRIRGIRPAMSSKRPPVPARPNVKRPVRRHSAQVTRVLPIGPGPWQDNGVRPADHRGAGGPLLPPRCGNSDVRPTPHDHGKCHAHHHPASGPVLIITGSECRGPSPSGTRPKPFVAEGPSPTEARAWTSGKHLAE